MSFVAKRMMTCPETGCAASAGIEKERLYVRPSMAWALWVARLRGTPGSGSVGRGDGVLCARHPESSMSKSHKDSESRFHNRAFKNECARSQESRAAFA